MNKREIEEKILYNSLIGKNIKITNSKNNNLIGKEGKIVLETKNLFHILKDKQIKKILKKDIIFEVKIEDLIIEVKGKILENSLCERIKKKRN